jgi:UDP-2,3-diacylglucosamine hydrolase
MMTADPCVGLVAGGGELPVALASHLRAAGARYFVARIQPFADAALADHPGADFPLGQFGARFAALRAAGCTEVVIIGNVRRPDLSQLDPDPLMMSLLPRLLEAGQRGDDALLREVVRVFEEQGFSVRGAETVLGDLLAPAGPLGTMAPDAAALADIAKADHLVADLGRWDIGQGAVVCEGLVLAVEAQEGTDAMLARVASLPVAVRGVAEARRGVLLKRPKPQQERRVDLPVIGVETIARAAAAGLAGVAVEAGGALISDRAAVAAAANAAGLFVFGFERA